MKDPAARFRALHEQPGAFVIPNPWDVGSARILAALGFEALATTSAGMAFGMGRTDGSVSPQDVLAHCRALVTATPLPVSADLEKGFGDSPESAAETILAAAQTGLAGCSIEDHTGRPDDPIFEKTLAVERIEAACEACQGVPGDFVFTARCENLLWGRPDLDAVRSLCTGSEPPRRHPHGLRVAQQTRERHHGNTGRNLRGRATRRSRRLAHQRRSRSGTKCL